MGAGESPRGPLPPAFIAALISQGSHGDTPFLSKSTPYSPDLKVQGSSLGLTPPPPPGLRSDRLPVATATGGAISILQGKGCHPDVSSAPLPSTRTSSLPRNVSCLPPKRPITLRAEPPGQFRWPPCLSPGGLQHSPLCPSHLLQRHPAPVAVLQGSVSQPISHCGCHLSPNRLPGLCTLGGQGRPCLTLLLPSSPVQANLWKLCSNRATIWVPSHSLELPSLAGRRLFS